MSIPDGGGWSKPEEPRTGHTGHFLALWRDWLVWACIALTAALFFALGLLATKQNRAPGDSLWIEQLPASELPGSMATTTPGTPTSDPAGQRGSLLTPQPAAAAAAVATPHTGNYVASKTGTKYYLPTCATAKRIKDENKVWFATKAAAEAAGYAPAANCKGL